MNKKINIIIIGVIIIFILSLFFINNKNENINTENMSDEEIAAIVENKIDKIEVNELSQENERSRMEIYVSKFISAIENGKYEIAYNMLYGEFQKNYFPNVESFEEYSKSKFPRIIGLEHTNIERIGDTYVLWVTMIDPSKGKEAGIEMNFVIREYELNNFELSFSVI